MELKFQECEACQAKPGSPILCASCLNNRGVIDTLTSQNRWLMSLVPPPDDDSPLSEPLQEAPSALQEEASVTVSMGLPAPFNDFPMRTQVPLNPDDTVPYFPTPSDLASFSKKDLKRLRKQLKKAVKILNKKESSC